MTGATTRRSALLAGGGLLPALRSRPARAARGDALRIVLITELTSLDPVFSQAGFVRNHGYFVYDQLFALDGRGVPRPQMVGEHEVSADRLRHRFALRPGLLFHDGTPVRAADAVASIRRWGQRDVVGRVLMAATESLEATDERAFVLQLKRPFGFVLDALARSTGSALFVMPERLARTPADVAITDPTGSGPFMLRPADFRVGDRVTYRRNPAYRPRDEPADGLAGGKVTRVEQVDWLSLPDPSTQAAALMGGEIDFVEQPTPDLLPTLERNRQVRTFALNPAGYQIWLRLNHAQPPFDDPRARQAVLHMLDQNDVLDSMGIRASERVSDCPAFFFCGTPLESRAGARGLGRPDLDRARALLRESGYDGRPVVLLNATDQALNNAAMLTVADAMRRAGMTVDVVASDWATVTQRRNRRDPPASGGWNGFVTVANVLDGQTPLTNLYLASPGAGGLTGWPDDAELESLRRQWWEEEDAAARGAVLDRVQARATEVLPYVPAAQFRTLAAHRSEVEGLRPTTIPVFWGVAKR